MTSDRDLVLLTAAFPFGTKSETFLESEVEVLAKRFRRILILPSRREPGLRPLPPDVTLVEMPWLDEPARRAKVRALASADAARILASAAADPGVRGLVRGARWYLDNLARNLIKARQLAGLIRDRRLDRAIFYDYWFENSTVALAVLRRAGIVSLAVSRAHAFDIYDERWAPLEVPFRRFKLRSLDRVFVVSRFGLDYLRSKAGPDARKLAVMRLGVREPPANPIGEGERPTVVSCGSMEPHKRIHRIPAVLGHMAMPLRWVHFGDGSMRPEVERAAAGLPDHVDWQLRGHVPNGEVLRFYREEPVDALFSLSRSEGLPVSMMEAIGAGIPVVAAAVDGVPEIVTEATGVRLDPEAGPEEAASALRRVLVRRPFDRARIRAFFREHFEATVNYNAFADALLDLAQATTQAP